MDNIMTAFCPFCLDDHMYNEENECINCGAQIPDGILFLEEVAGETAGLKKTIVDKNLEISRLQSELQELKHPNYFREKKNRLSDELIKNGFVPHAVDEGVLVKDCLLADFTNELQVKVVIIGDNGRWKSEFEADYCNISSEQLLNIGHFINEVLMDKTD